MTAIMNPAGIDHPMKQKTGKTKFRPRARIISLIGEELISDEPVALVELVKNAYDADAKEVKIEFRSDDAGNFTSIAISDDGEGMTLDTVLHSWFEPGTIQKKQKARSKKGRILQGAKGIGRFASARLGSSLLMETKHASSNQVITVLTTWDNFDDDSYLDDIEIEYEVSTNPDRDTGTALYIETANYKLWTDDALNDLHSRLSRLISPFNEISNFNIFLDVPGYPQISGEVEPPDFLSSPKYFFSGSVSKNGSITGEIKLANSKKIITKSKPPRKNKSEYPQCGPFSFEIRAWDRDDLKILASKLNQNVAQLRKILNTYSGVSIYRDGFRVHPYGEPANDWLRLDLRSRLNPTRNLANNQIIASVQISRKLNADLKDRSTREGMIKNEAYEALHEWFIQVLTLLEEDRYSVRRTKTAPTQIQPIFEAFDLSEAVKDVKDELGEDHPVTKIVQETAKQVTEGSDRVQDAFSRLLMSAGLGHMVDIVIHEMGSPLGKIGREIVIIERQLKKLISGEQYSPLNDRFASIRAWLEQLINLRKRLDPQTAGKRGRAIKFDIATEISANIDLYENITTKNKIAVNFERPTKPILVKMSRAVLSQVVANLLDNSVFWVIEKHGAKNGGKINITIRRLKAGFSLTITDDGTGISEANREVIFEPYFSTKPHGMGLGLHIVRLLMEPYGQLTLQERDGRKGASFKASFERGVGL
jgi:signal transduction histidine kinase